ncbi:hypothetical protein [Methylopila sp. 73B]|uniref:hypothetical protein n=1 Tax=Methylopila sp. 73B TaxID=1120792 RepID=UPI000379E87D|nr:hypothetical protein [Methylopila sp. 73B]
MTAPLPETIAELRELLAKATPGPWNNDMHYDEIRGDIVPGLERVLCDVVGIPARISANAALIVAAVNALPSLLTEAARGVESEAEIAALKAENERLRRVLEEIANAQIQDQPVESVLSSTGWAKMHHMDLRVLARAALLPPAGDQS